jgi:hypothetical protein
VAPLPIVLYWAAAGTPGLLQLLLLALIALWGVRLTANWMARWRGMGDEDFRYVEIRGRTGRLYWPASFGSIHLLPTIWVFLGLLPVYPALVRSSPVTALQLVGLVVTAAAIAIEATADRQLRAFLRTRRDPEAILDKGLWALCRHPNYLGEVLFWWGLYLFGLAAEPAWAWSRGPAVYHPAVRLHQRALDGSALAAPTSSLGADHEIPARLAALAAPKRTHRQVTTPPARRRGIFRRSDERRCCTFIPTTDRLLHPAGPAGGFAKP